MMKRLKLGNTLLELAHFYWLCIRRAFHGRFWAAVNLTGGVSTILLLWLLAFPTTPERERFIGSTLPLYFFVAAYLLMVIWKLLKGPFELYRDEKAAKLALEELRTPKLEVILPTGMPVGVSMAGNTWETHGGNRVTTINSWDSDAIYLLCLNNGEVVAKDCRARILYVSRENGDDKKQVNIIESVELPWAKNDRESHLIENIPPDDCGRIWLASVRSNGNLWLYRDISELPVHYHQVFGEAGQFKILMQVDAENLAPIQVLLSIHSEAGERPTQSGVWRGKASVEVLAQGSPKLEHPDLPSRLGSTGRSVGLLAQ